MIGTEIGCVWGVVAKGGGAKAIIEG